jgi:ribosomal protein L29
MVIRFHIPGGEMAVEAAVFFREARMWQIRRMLKMYRESGSGGEYKELVRQLGETAAGIRDELRALQEEYDAALRRVSEKSGLKEARRELSRLNTVAREIKREMEIRGKLLVRYGKILKDAERILGTE